ncbi:hypothetical protein HAX54_047609, partial [Datura stramonium]|nr:hypothetical protein [Datura stramonium]
MEALMDHFLYLELREVKAKELITLRHGSSVWEEPFGRMPYIGMSICYGCESKNTSRDIPWRRIE